MKVNKVNSKALEDALIQNLRFSGIDKANLSELVKLAAGLHDHGLEKVRGFPLGKPPIVDGLRVSGDVEIARIGDLLGTILPRTARFSGVRLFPKGMPWPELYHVEVDLGAPIQTPQQFGP